MVVVFLEQNHRRPTALHELNTALTRLQQALANDGNKRLDYRYTISLRVVQTNEEGKDDVLADYFSSRSFSVSAIAD